MEKLLHERLSGWGDRRPVDILNKLGEEFDCAGTGWKGVISVIADEIERYYIPRPRFENGEPVQFGDVVQSESGEADRVYIMTFYGNGSALLRDGTPVDICELDNGEFVPRPRFEDGEPVQFDDEVKGCNGPVKAMLIYFDGSGRVYGRSDNQCEEPLSGAIIEEGIKRPAPKVLDADGVEIKEGDTVYLKPRPTPYVVIEFKDGQVVATSPAGERNQFPHSYYLTHREPDSLEKAMEHFKSILEDKDGLDYEAEEKLWDVHKRLTALIERGA